MPSSLSSLRPFRRAGQGYKVERWLDSRGHVLGSQAQSQLHGQPSAGAIGSGERNLSGFIALVRLLFTQQNYSTEAKNEHGH